MRYGQEAVLFRLVWRASRRLGDGLGPVLALVALRVAAQCRRRAETNPMRKTAPTNDNSAPFGYVFTHHAKHRMGSRRLPPEAINAALCYGRVVFTRGAEIHAIGRKEVLAWAREGIDIADYEGVQVVCTSEGVVLTVYRNRDLRGLRPKRRERTHAKVA